MVDLYGHYQNWCRENHLRSFPSKPFSRIAKEEIEITMGPNFAMILLVKTASQGGGGKDWHWWREPFWRMWKLRPAGPWVNPMTQLSCSLVLGRRFDGVDHLNVPAKG